MKKILFCFLFTSLISQQLLAIPFQGTKILIAAPSSYAVEVGKKVYREGGNVVDVAVAVGLTLAVTNPYYAALGGGGFALVKMNNSPVSVLDFRETAPEKTSAKYFLSKEKTASTKGGAAIGVPGVPAGLWALHKKYGKLKWQQLFKHPLKLAKDGFHLSGEWVQRTTSAQTNFTPIALNYFTRKGVSYKPGDLFKQKHLIKALKKLQTQNLNGFYSGAVAKDIVKSVNKSGGDLSLNDLKKYKVRWLKPLTTEFANHKIYLMPPPSSGGLVIKTALELIQRLELSKVEVFSAQEFHLLAEILSRSFRGRSLLGDPDFHKNPLNQLLSDKYLSQMAKSIDKKKTIELKPLGKDAKEGNETTHFSILDSQGNAVSLTVTLNGSYGSGVVSEKFGIALNNEMDDFTTRPGEPNMFGLIQGSGNYVEPGKRPLSSMSPTLIEKDGQIVMALGAPGGPRIISGVLQTMYRVLINQLDLDTAIQAPRVHHQFLPHKLFVDQWRFQNETLNALKKLGHDVEPSWHSRVNAVHLKDDGNLEAAFDSRGEGAAGGF